MATRGVVPAAGVMVSVTGVPDSGVAGLVASVRLVAVLTPTVNTADVLSPANAVTFASRLVVSVTRASPLLSVRATVADSVPASALNVTGTPVKRLPAASSAEPMSVMVPPLAGTRDGEAVSTTELAAAAPTRIKTAFAGVSPSPPVAPPDVARISAMPEAFPAMNVVVALPPRVSTSAGSTLPSVDVKRTSVPLCTGVPLDSDTKAVICVLPPIGSVEVEAEIVIVDSDGASSGTCSQPAVTSDASAINSATLDRVNISSPFCVCCAIDRRRLAGTAVHIADARLSRRIGRVGFADGGLPVRGPRGRVVGHLPDVLLADQRVERRRPLVLVSVIPVDRFAHSQQVLLEHRLAGAGDAVVVHVEADAREDRDDHHHDEDFDERESPGATAADVPHHQSLYFVPSSAVASLLV